MNVDLTSALFLAPAPRVAVVGPIVNGRPALLAEPALDRRLARRLAAATVSGDGVLARTSFHGLLDAIGCTSPPGTAVLVDEGVYPVTRWAVAAADSPGRRMVATFRHHDRASAIEQARRAGGPVVVVTDGLCGSCLRPAPLVELDRLARATGGHLVVDDTLAAGVLGRRRPGAGPFGSGGAGTPAWLGADPGRLVVVASLAKAYGVPLAVVTGPAEVVARIRHEGPSRTHASPPTRADVAALAALPRPLELERRRRRLSRLVTAARAGAVRLGLTPEGIPFPVLHLATPAGPAIRLSDGLGARGITTLVTRGRCTGRTAVTLMLRADLPESAVDRLLGALGRELRWSAA